MSWGKVPKFERSNCGIGAFEVNVTEFVVAIVKTYKLKLVYKNNSNLFMNYIQYLIKLKKRL